MGLQCAEEEEYETEKEKRRRKEEREQGVGAVVHEHVIKREIAVGVSSPLRLELENGGSKRRQQTGQML
ncbi:hypothetical protein ACLOJK_037668 [Asimina triloba]